MENQKGKFSSNFGFLMACLGSAVGLGNLWSFPYKLGIGGGFAFLLIYVIFCIVIGYPLVLSEIAVGRKTQKAAVEAYDEVKKGFAFNGVLQTIVPWLIVSFYCCFGGYIMRYLLGSITAFGGGWLATDDAGASFGMMLDPANSVKMVIWMLVFLLITVAIVFGGVSGGIERFCNVAMPALFVMLLIIVIRSCTLPGAGAGLKFLFSPDLSMWKTDFFGVLTLAGGQMFFSLSLASACLIAYGSYLGKDENLEKDAAFITIGDSVVALLAGMAIMPAVFSFGLEPGAGPGLLFVTMTTVFQSMGAASKVFQLIFWLLVFFAALSSSIGMMEAGIAAILDSRIKAGKPADRIKVTSIMGIVAFIGNFLTTYDCLGSNPKMNWFHILGQPDVLDVWDCIAEGLLMPLTGLIMAILLGWVVPHYIDDEVKRGSDFKSRGLYNFCIKWLGPIFMAMIVYGQLTSVFAGLFA
ncbi:MAG: sodium-dependent transporter [Mogibacterium sp.]|nr:sodium-dependent transporter [Mogibacterium sp.]